MANENINGLLDGVRKQTSGFDTKAVTLLSATGIASAAGSIFFGLFKAAARTGFEDFLYKALFIIFIGLALGAAFCFLMCIFPRDKYTSVKYPNYFMDITEMSFVELKNSITSYYEGDELPLAQLMINSRLCRVKYRWLVRGIAILFAYVVDAAILAAVILLA